MDGHYADRGESLTGHDALLYWVAAHLASDEADATKQARATAAPVAAGRIGWTADYFPTLVGAGFLAARTGRTGTFLLVDAHLARCAANRVVAALAACAAGRTTADNAIAAG